MNVQERVLEMTARMREDATAYLGEATQRLGELRQPLQVLSQAGNQFNALSSHYVREVAKLALTTYADLRKAAPARPARSRKATKRPVAARRSRASAARRARPETATA